MNETRVAGTALRFLGLAFRGFGFLALIQMVVVANLRPSEIPHWYWQAVALGLAGQGFAWVGDYVERKGLA